MNVIVHFPKSGKGREELAKCVAAIQADAVISYLNSLPYTRENKLRLLKELKGDREESKINKKRMQVIHKY